MKYMRSFFVGCLLLGIYSPVAAQPWYKIVGQKTQEQLLQLQKLIVKPVGVSTQQLETAILRSFVQTPVTLPAQVEKAIIPLKERNKIMRYFRVPGTAFMIEEIYQGKKYLWGVTATHYGYQQPAVEKKRFSYTLLQFSAQGNENANDVSIFPIPEELKDKFVPLKLAEKSPARGEELFSLSFFDKQFQYTPNRKVLETSPLRVITSVKADPEICREGECGSPLINQKGEVVGMIVGGSYRRQIGYAVPVENIRDILKAFHQQRQLYKPVLLNDKELLQLNVNEAITRVSVKRQDNSVLTRLTHHQEKELDYAHLENFIDLSQAKELTLEIEKTPFSPIENDQQKHIRYVVYNLHTQEIKIFDN